MLVKLVAVLLILSAVHADEKDYTDFVKHLKDSI